MKTKKIVTDAALDAFIASAQEQGAYIAESKVTNGCYAACGTFDLREALRRAFNAEGRPANCRNRLRDEGEHYPRSGCDSCRNGGLFGCPHEIERDVPGDLL